MVDNVQPCGGFGIPGLCLISTRKYGSIEKKSRNRQDILDLEHVQVVGIVRPRKGSRILDVVLKCFRGN